MSRSESNSRTNSRTNSQANGSARIALPNGDFDDVVLEAPLVLEAGGGQLVTMRTPMGEAADLDWGVGFLASEGVIASMEDVSSMQWIGSDPTTDPMPPIADCVRFKLSASVPPNRREILQRNHEMRASCGICGVESAAALVQSLGHVAKPRAAPTEAAMEAMLVAARAAQSLFLTTGGCHGAAIFDPSGKLVAIAEDIGRHNALDRVIGACVRRGASGDGGVAAMPFLNDATLVLSGRAGYELIVKAIRVGIPVVVSVGAASSFAVALAKAADVRLIGFARGGGKYRVYS